MRTLSSRILTIALVCASLYAALLGAGAFAQDEESTPAPAETAAPAQTAEAPKPDPTAKPPEAPAQAQAPAQTRQPEQTPAATPGKPAAAPAPKLGVDKVKRARKDDKHPNREQGSAEKCPRNG